MERTSEQVDALSLVCFYCICLQRGEKEVTVDRRPSIERRAQWLGLVRQRQAAGSRSQQCEQRTRDCPSVCCCVALMLLAGVCVCSIEGEAADGARRRRGSAAARREEGREQWHSQPAVRAGRKEGEGEFAFRPVSMHLHCWSGVRPSLPAALPAFTFRSMELEIGFEEETTNEKDNRQQQRKAEEQGGVLAHPFPLPSSFFLPCLFFLADVFPFLFSLSSSRGRRAERRMQQERKTSFSIH